MKQYEVIPHRYYQHSSGRRASIYGACPWVSETDRPNWQLVTKGFTIRDNRHNTVGMCRVPFKTEQEASAFIVKWGDPDC